MAFRTLIVAVFLSLSADARVRLATPLDGQDNRIVLIGNGFIEQERTAAFLEARLMRHALGRSMTCRNLGWSGDSVWGESRPAGFENPAGVDRLIKNATELKPTLILVDYGMIESFEGQAGLPHFTQGYNALLDRLEKLTPHVVLMSPAIQEGDAKRSAELEAYGAAVADIAAQRKLTFIDLYHALAANADAARPLTSNGITFNDRGYWLVGQIVERQLRLDDSEAWMVDLQADGKVNASKDASITASPDHKFQVTEKGLPLPKNPDGSDDTDGVVHFRNLSAGGWLLKVDGKDAVVADEKQWADGVRVPLESDRVLGEQLRQAIVESEATFYRRSRPFNDHSRHFTYIDKDYPLYDAQLAEQDKKIAALRQPVVHELQLVQKEANHP